MYGIKHNQHIVLVDLDLRCLSSLLFYRCGSEVGTYANQIKRPTTTTTIIIINNHAKFDRSYLFIVFRPAFLLLLFASLARSHTAMHLCIQNTPSNMHISLTKLEE